jgi:ParB family transcriptional regulator, chromosome partitioning protein
MSVVGQLSPIRIRINSSNSSKHYQLIFGHRRLIAAQKLGWMTIKAEIADASDEDVIILSIAENLNRKDFTDFEKAQLFKKLRDQHR